MAFGARTSALQTIRAPGLPLPPAPAALGGVLTFFFHYDTDFPEVLEFTHATNKRYGWGL